MNKPLISVIMTVYNGEKYIEESIKSILVQSYGKFELIIVLDGCTDNTEDIVTEIFRRYRGDFQIIKEEENKGCATGRSIGIDAANGSLIAIQDADDISYSDRFDKQVKFMTENPDIFCVGGFLTKTDEEGKILGVMNYPPEKHDDVVKMVTDKCFNPILDPSTMFRKKDFYEIGGYSLDKKIYLVPDFDLWLKAILSGKKFYNMQEILSKYRVHDDSMTSRKKGMFKQHMAVWNNFMRRR